MYVCVCVGGGGVSRVLKRVFCLVGVGVGGVVGGGRGSQLIQQCCCWSGKAPACTDCIMWSKGLTVVALLLFSGGSRSPESFASDCCLYTTEPLKGHGEKKCLETFYVRT